MDTSQKPYYDDYDTLKNFSKVLFKPGPAVQARELNQLQTLLQEQVRRLGDHILKNGTVVSGGQITNHPTLPYVKLKDVDTDTESFTSQSLFNRHLTNSAGVKAIVVTSTAGQEATPPDLKTAYVKYLNAGTDGASLVFAPDDVLAVTDALTGEALFSVTVAGVATTPIGVGYGVTIDEGIIYHGGHFTRVDKQLLLVTKYDNVPDDLVVGFDTTYEIVTADDDASLYDNSLGTPNSNAPGADRLKTNAGAIVLDKASAAARSDFLGLIEFSNGEPFRQDPNTQYSIIEQNLARRTYEESGNYVIDQFNLNTKSGLITEEPTIFEAVIDPGVAYINGYRVSTERNHSEDLPKGTTTRTINDVSSSIDYGNYITVDRFNGTVASLIGTNVNLNDTAQTYALGGTVTIAGATIGTARVRGVKITQTNPLRVNIYLYDILMNAGQPFTRVLSVNTTNFNANINGSSVLNNTQRSAAIFGGPATAIKSISNVVFTQQKSDWGTVTTNSSGTVTLTLTGSDQFEYTGTLTQNILDEYIVTPLANALATTAKTGTVATTSGSPTVTGTSTTFTSDFAPGQYIDIAGTVGLVDSVTSNTVLTLAANHTVTASGQAIKSYYPKYVPLRPISGSVAGQTLTLNVMTPSPATNLSAIIPIRKSSSPSGKTVNRNVVARLNLSTNVAAAAGPWCLGVPDAIHLRNVYLGANTTFTSVSAGITDVTNDFYIDSNHGTDVLGLGYLYKRSGSSLALTSTDRLLAVFDVLTTTGTNYRTVESYPLDDGVTLAASAATMNTLELPEVFGAQGSYYDVRDAIDFRPIPDATLTLQTAQSTAPINPTENSWASRFSSIGHFPAPQSRLTADVEYYLPRVDRVVVTPNNQFVVIQGQPGTATPPLEPKDAITINALVVPPYPSVPYALSNDLAEIADTRIANEKIAKVRQSRFTITTVLDSEDIANEQPRGYRMEDIGEMDRRLQNVEYYLSLTMAESQTLTRAIPSASNTADRFKFGFFVDSFSDSALSDISNPQYYASVAEGVLRPKTENIVVVLDPDGGPTIPHNNYILVQQPFATNGPLVIVSPTPPPAPVPTPGGTVVVNPPPKPPVSVINPPPAPPAPVTQITQTMTSMLVINANTQVNGSGLVYEEKEFYLSSLSGQMELYFNFHDNQNAVEIFQGTTSGFTPAPGSYIKDGRNGVTYTSGDVSGGKFDGCFNLSNTNLDQNGLQTGGHYAVEDTGKITAITYNPANGRYIKIRIYKYRGSGNGMAPGTFQYRFFFPIDSVTTINSGTVPSTFGYNGVVTSISPPQFNIGSTTAVNGATIYYAIAQTFRIKVSGLKPSAAHTFTFDNTDQTASCTSVGTTGMKSNSTGVLVFDFAYGGTAPTTTYLQSNNVTSSVPGTKSFTVKVSDNSSSASSVVTSPSYAEGGSGSATPPSTSSPDVVSNPMANKPSLV